MQTERFDTVVIGAGQAGLVTGYHLQRAGRSFVILDGDERVGDSLAPAVRLAPPVHARVGVSAWTGCRSRPKDSTRPTKDEFADYLEAYATRFELPVRTGVRVDGVRRDGDRYVVTAGDRRVRGGERRRGVGRAPRPAGPGVRAPTSIRRSSSCTPARTGTRRSCGTVASWSSASGTRVPTSRSRSRRPTRRRCRGARPRSHPAGHRRLDRAQHRVPRRSGSWACTCSRAAPRSDARRSRRCRRRATCSCA